jgi:antibiotic biosynthesis monooxygenase (ABM) superfamily enzyme
MTDCDTTYVHPSILFSSPYLDSCACSIMSGCAVSMKLLQPLTVPRVKRMVKRWLDGMALLTQMESMISYKFYCMFYIYMYTEARA